MFALLSGSQALFHVVAPIGFFGLYRETRDTLEGIVFITTTCLYVIPLLLTGYVISLFTSIMPLVIIKILVAFILEQGSMGKERTPGMASQFANRGVVVQ